jgi:hypothetical protein
MTRRIYKYTIVLDDRPTVVTLPVGSEVVMVGVQDAVMPGTVCLWAEHEVDEDLFCDRAFVVHGTGHKINTNEVHVGSFIQEPFVWHVYEVMPEDDPVPVAADGT